MKKLNFNLLAFLAMGLLIFTGCKKDDDPKMENEEELITNLVYTLTPQGGGTPITLTFNDPDGEGANAPVITTSGNLAANTTYTGVVTLSSPDEDKTAEIREEDDEHQFFFAPSGGLNLTVAYTDVDNNGNPVGLGTTVTTTAASTGTLTVTLKHQPDIKTATTTVNDGETDIEVTFNVTIQ